MKQNKIDAAAAIEKAKQEEAVVAAAAKKAFDIAYKNSIKELIRLCTETLRGSNYDRFWVEANLRKIFKTREVNETFIAKIGEI